MTLRVWPTAVAFPSDARTLPPSLAATLAGAVAPVVLLVAGRRAIDMGWAPSAAVGLARAWCDGVRVVLADLAVAEPSLDRVLGEPNDEGLADVFLFGASLRRVIRTDESRCFGFIPAGASPADSHAVLTDAGWRHVVAHFFREGATLLAYIPADAEGLQALALRLGAVIALAGPGDLDELERILPDDAAVLAVLEAPDAVAEPPVAEVPVSEAEPPVAEVPVSEAELPAAEVPVAEAAVAEAEMPPAEPPVSEAEMPPAEAPVAEPPVAEMPVPAEVPVAEAGMPVAEMPVAEPPGAEAEVPVQQAGAAELPRPAVGGAEPREPGDERHRPAVMESPRDARVDALWARRAEAQARGGAGAPQVDVVPGRKPTEQERLREPFVLMRQPEPRRRWVVMLLWLAAGIVVGLVILFAVLVYLGRTAKVTPLDSSGSGELAPRGDPQAAGGSVADSLPYSVAIEAYPQYAPAVERATQLSREQVGVSFFVTPSRERGSVYYHVMAGPVADSVGAAALMQRLLDAGVKTGASQWDIVSTRLAYFLGDYASRASAETRAEALAERRVPAYVVEVPLPGGPARWRVYAGAFQGTADAAVLRPVLRNAGVRDTLVPRIGVAPR